MLISSKRIYTPKGCINGTMRIENGKIIEITEEKMSAVDLDFYENRILAGIIDTHNHGALGYGLLDGYDAKTIEGYLQGLASQGVSGILPTSSRPELYHLLVQAAKNPPRGAKILGIHSEGPYLNRVGEKGIDKGHPDIDLDYLKKMVQEADGLLKLVGIAPELPLAKEAIEYLTSQDVRVAFAHTNMMYEEANQAFSWGISVTTHTANVMSGIHHRNMGGLGACLLNDDVYNEVICDGKHVSNEMLEIMFRIKRDPYHKFMMVSDCINFSGAPEGKYRMPEEDEEITITKDGYCLLNTGRLFGSTMPVLKGIKNLVENVGISMKYASMMASENPAKVYGYPQKGTLEIGKDADFIVIDDDYECLATFVEGKCVYERQTDGNVFNPEVLTLHRVDEKK